MNLEKINLNLLVALDALLTEKQVTRAAQKLHISQSAMSIALAQLRELLNDDLLIRANQRMVPTKRALELQPHLRRLLEEIKTVIQSPQTFDPATAECTFRVGMNDYTEFLVLPQLLAKISKVAPKVSLKIINLNHLDNHELFEAEQLDIAVGFFYEKNTLLQTEPLFAEDAVCVARKGHPALQKPLTLKRLLEHKHIANHLHSMPVLGRIDRALQKLGMQRDIALAIPHMIAACYLVRHTDYLLVTMRRLAEELSKSFGLIMQELPFTSETCEIFMAWQKPRSTDPAHIWLRSLISGGVSK